MSLKILVVDDSSLMHDMYEMVLRRYGRCKTLHAMNGREALEMLGQHADTRLIILDINMPGMNGLEFLSNYKGSGLKNPAPVIIVSTEGKAEDTRRGLEAGAVAYLKKPFRPTDLQVIIDKVLGAIQN